MQCKEKGCAMSRRKSVQCKGERVCNVTLALLREISKNTFWELGHHTVYCRTVARPHIHSKRGTSFLILFVYTVVKSYFDFLFSIIVVHIHSIVLGSGISVFEHLREASERI